MAEDEKSFDGYLEKLAILCDAMDDLHQCKKAVVFQLKREDFIQVRNKLKTVGDDKNEFKIDISGSEFIYLLDE